jgi:hypothetical protein
MWPFRKLRLLSGALCATALSAAPLWFRTQELPWAAVGTEYRAAIETQVDGRCPQSDVSFSVIAGALPRGFTIQGDVLLGNPQELANFRFRLRGANSCAAAEQDYVLQVTGRPILRVTAEQLVFEYRIGDPVPKSQTLLVAGTWPELPYSIRGEAPWLRIRLNAGVTPRAGSGLAGDAVTVEMNPKGLAAGLYESDLIFYTSNGGTTPIIPVKLKILPAAPKAESQR